MKKGFTLIELLIVITIIAILAGAVTPYVQQYIDDARMARAKQDLNEIRNALMRYEVDQNRPYEQKDISGLVGPYLSKSIADPWGSPYVICNASSSVYSVGGDMKDDSGDEIIADFRPPLALTRAYWCGSHASPTDKDGDVFDKLMLKFTRPVSGIANIQSNCFFFEGLDAGANVTFGTPTGLNTSMTVTFELDKCSPIKVGYTRIGVSTSAGNKLVDLANNRCVASQPTVIKFGNGHI